MIVGWVWRGKGRVAAFTRLGNDTGGDVCVVVLSWQRQHGGDGNGVLYCTNKQ